MFRMQIETCQGTGMTEMSLSLSTGLDSIPSHMQQLLDPHLLWTFLTSGLFHSHVDLRHSFSVLGRIVSQRRPLSVLEVILIVTLARE